GSTGTAAPRASVIDDSPLAAIARRRRPRQGRQSRGRGRCPKLGYDRRRDALVIAVFLIGRRTIVRRNLSVCRPSCNRPRHSLSPRLTQSLRPPATQPPPCQQRNSTSPLSSPALLSFEMYIREF